MQALTDILVSIGNAYFELARFLLDFWQDTVSMIVTLAKLPTILVTVLQWTNSIGVLPYVTVIITLAIVYKILGREG